MKYDLICFDLDGTLTDSAAGVINSLLYVAQNTGVTRLPDNMMQLVGPPVKETFDKYFFDVPYEDCIRHYRDYFSTKGITQNTLYPDVAQTLKALHDSGVRSVIATSKPEVYSKIIAKDMGIDSYLKGVYGSSMDLSRIGKAAVLHYALQEEQPQKAVLIGDRFYDADGAKANHVDFIGITYGYGSREELEATDAVAVLDSLPEVLDFIQSNT